MPFKQSSIDVTKVPEEPVMLNSRIPLSQWALFVFSIQFVAVSICVYICMFLYCLRGLLCVFLYWIHAYLAVFIEEPKNIWEVKKQKEGTPGQLWLCYLRFTTLMRRSDSFPLSSASWGKSVQQEQMWPLAQSPSENKQLPWQPENTMWNMNWPLRFSLMLQDLHIYACLWCRFPSYESMLRVKIIIYFISFSYPLAPIPFETVQMGNST